jgi:hypothetical protein
LARADTGTVIVWATLLLLAGGGVAPSFSEARLKDRVSRLPTCGKQYAEAGPAAEAGRESCRKPWTVLVYMAADNDLSPYALWDLYEMEAGFASDRRAAGSTARSDLVVQLEMPREKDARRIHVFQSPENYDRKLDLSYFQSRTADQVRSPVVGKAPLWDARQRAVPTETTLADFVEWGMRKYPADHVMVIVWGHGKGQAGLAFSQSRGTKLTTPELARALRLAESRAVGGERIDLYGADACLMQTAEVISEFSGAARFVAGSSQVQNFLGLPYRRLMFEINTGRFDGERERPGVAGSDQAADEAYLLARMLPRLFKASLSERGLHGSHLPEAKRTATMSVIASDEFERALLPAMGDLAKALLAYLKADPMRAIDLVDALKDIPAFDGGVQDLGGVLRVLGSVAGNERDSSEARAVMKAASETSSALSRATVAFSLGTDYVGDESKLQLLGFRALSVWMPLSAEDYKTGVRSHGSRLDRAVGGDWLRWIGKLFE